MNEFQREIYKTIDKLTDKRLKQLGYDKTKRGKVMSVSGTKCTVQIDGEEYTCRLRRGIYIEPNDIVYVMFPQNNDVDKYVDTILGGNETPDYLVISAEEILEKLKTVDGSDSGLDADTLDGKHASEFVTLSDIGDIDISGDTIVQNINSSSAIIDDKNLSENANDSIDKKHGHSNKSIIDTITQVLIDGWDSAVAHISDTIKHIKSSERELWNTVANKSDLNHTHIETDITDLDKYTKTETDNKLSVKADKTYVDTELNKKLNSSLKGITNGLAELDDNGKVPSSQLPSYVDDVLEFDDYNNFPTIGENGKIYIAIDTNKTYRWGGTSYVPISSDLALGETSSTAYRGDRGKIAYDHSQIIHDKILIGLEDVDNVKQATKVEFDNHNNDNAKHITSTERTKWNLIDNKVDKIVGKQLSTEDFTTTEKSKLSSIATGATKNDTDTNLKNRANHTGTQTSSTISDFSSAVKSTVLSGLSTATSGLITTSDTILSALGKIQKQISDNLSTLTNHTSNTSNPHNVTKYQIGLGNVDNTSDLAKPISTAIQTALDEKVNNNQVLTNVPSGAKFTDTVTTINGKTGAISKADIVALGIPSQDTVYTHPVSHPASMITESATKRFVTDVEKVTWNSKAEVSDIPTKVSQLQNDSNYVTQGELGSAGYGDMTKNIYDVNNNGVVDNAEKVNGFTVGTNVPANAKFTDTIYTHPSSHPASMITESTTKRFVSDTEKSTWNNKAETSDIPTNTSQLINDSGFLTSLPEHNHDVLYEPKNSNIQSHISNISNPHNTTKSQVGLGNVLNYGISTQLEAENGIINTKYMTPLRTKQAIDKAMTNVSSGTEVVVGNIDPNNNNVHWIDTSI